MKKIIYVFLLVGALFVSGVAFAQNQEYIGPLNEGNTESPIRNYTQLENILKSVVNWAYTLFFVVAILMFILAGYNFLRGGTDEKRIQVAKSQLKWGVVAIVVALLATGFSLIINSFITAAR